MFGNVFHMLVAGGIIGVENGISLAVKFQRQGAKFFAQGEVEGGRRFDPFSFQKNLHKTVINEQVCSH